jgi:hypothetical protein
MLWGAVAGRLKSLALLHDRPVDQHGKLIELGRYIARMTKDEELEAQLRAAGHLHTNYCEAHLGPEESEHDFRASLRALRKLGDLVAARVGARMLQPPGAEELP